MFTYRSSQQPLEGFTIKRGLGKGGFGEVYFAVSQGGKEVALKFIRDYTATELRGTEHCLNLKHPNLVHLYDLRRDGQGRPWLVMEFVIGETLAQLIARHPRGLPEAMVRAFFPALARGVAHLHDHGVLHRDLKPGNVFLEHGQLKIGDYGLCKALTGSVRDPQTTGVGTVHYMAPEVSRGNYSKAVDVYACGVILYEMLSGRLPFEGESLIEVMMRHETDAPDLDAVPAAYRAVVARALEKRPERRHSGMLELLADFERAAADPAADLLTLADPYPDALDVPLSTAAPLAVTRARPRPQGAAVTPPGGVPIPGGSRPAQDLGWTLVKGTPLALLPALAWAVFHRNDALFEVSRVYLLVMAAVALVALPAAWWARRPAPVWARRVTLGGGGMALGGLACWLDGWAFALRAVPLAELATPAGWGRVLDLEPGGAAHFARLVFFFGAGLALMQWWLNVDPRRAERFTLAPVLGALFWSVALVFAWPLGAAPNYALWALPSAAFVLQLAAPFRPAAARPAPRRLRLPAGAALSSH